MDAGEIRSGLEGPTPPLTATGETVMSNEYQANAERQTSDDTNIVSILTTALIVATGGLLVAISFALV